MSNTVDKEAIEPILLKHIIEHQKKYLRSGLTPDQRKINAKWYLVSSTASYRGLIAGINELLQSNSEATQKELQYWKQRCEAAELFIKDSPFNDVMKWNQVASYERWQILKNKSI